ncbi:STP22 [Candida pseudojiufengensis]|uniref:STP22 n=1 Tax=Candida pseudojiufengensis TaxID=497109 RepID=UPI0022243586|nr:STP22 [Candida pseudojiufengensis]KAI5964660.1 STP22 [Candida pseudojiufengensis]
MSFQQTSISTSNPTPYQQSQSQLPQQVANWLFNVIQPSYKFKQLVYSHVYQFLQLHLKKNLNFRIRTQVYTSEDTGESNLLINLFGDIYINDQISVPIVIWIPLDYPNESCPLVYIVPNHSKNWFLNPNNYVDSQGKFYHPYLASWYRHCMDGNVDLVHFQLIELINIIYHSVKLEVPIRNGTSFTPSRMVSPPVTETSSAQSTGPPLPTKPPKLLSPQNTTPLKYQSPLPLPQEQTSLQNRSYTGNTSTYVSQSSVLSPQPVHEQTRTSVQPRVEYSNELSSNSSPQTLQSNIRQTNPEDLVDRINEMSIDDPLRKRSLEILSSKFNEIFTNDPINKQITFANENLSKADALFNQLNHHYQQAEQNSIILEDHLNHLTSQLTNSTKLNQELNILNQQNIQAEDKVHLNSNNEILLDDLIIPDSPLVKQLYQTVSEIKAIKDTMNLISGNFLNNNELINDKNCDNCVKIMRNLGRELFWLELTKIEIVNIMNLKQ